MKQGKELKAISYVAGFFVIASSLLLVIFLVLAAAGLIHPRQEKLTVCTQSISKIYDGTPLLGGRPTITYGQLHSRHTLQVRKAPEFSEVGEYQNAPEIWIRDETGADVTEQYDIHWEYGTVAIQARKITLSSTGKSKVYDGEALTPNDVWLSVGTLVPGHTLTAQAVNAVVLPGTERVQPVYQILSENGRDVTDQYDVYENMGDLTVMPISITLTTESASKMYDGESLSAKKWQHTDGALLEGHTIEMTVSAALEDVGSIPNKGNARILDQDGKDVTSLYQIQYQYGTLEVQAIPLYITTMSDQKIYDGTGLSCPQWKLTQGNLDSGASIQVLDFPVQTKIGTMDNVIHFQVTDRAGRDITSRYAFIFDYGTLSVQPRAVTIRTGSAQKVFDGTPLSCEAFEIIKGSLCENERIEITGISITDVGYSENYVLDCTVYRKESDGSVTDVSACYRISFDFGMLKITAD